MNPLDTLPRPPALTPGQKVACDAIMSGENVFLSGSAGTGKSFVIARVLEELAARDRATIACAPTARAALVIGGTTIHSAFHLPVAPIVNPSALEVPDAVHVCETVLIDEVSMVRRDVFDAVSTLIARENTLRRLGANPEHPEPIQLVCVGDFCQLPPVADRGQGTALADHFGVNAADLGRSLFAFQSDSWASWDFQNHYLTQVVRQPDADFARSLDRARVGDPSCIGWFNDRSCPQRPEGAVIIEGRNRDVDALNDAELDRLPGEARTYLGQIVGDAFQPLPAPTELRLKVGARVMATYNTGSLANGELGSVVELRPSSVVFRSDEGVACEVKPNTWTYFTYGVNQRGGTDRLVGQTVGAYTQLPLRLGWAVSIHKSQGQTYDSVEVDPATWDAGMLYVALSRVRRVDRMHLTRPISRSWLMTSQEVVDFYATIPGAPRFFGRVFSGFTKERPAKDFSPADPDHIDQANPLWGKGVVFTGDFSDGTERDSLRQLVCDLGGKPQTSVSGKTDYVVQADADYAVGRETGRTRRARDNAASGKRDTQVISETQWHALVDAWVSA